MPSFALDNLTSYPPVGQTSTGPGSTSADGSSGEFDDALQRAGPSSTDAAAGTNSASNSVNGSTASSSATQSPTDNSGASESSEPHEALVSQNPSASQSENAGQNAADLPSTGVGHGGKLNRWALFNRQSAQAAAAATQTAANASANPNQTSAAASLPGAAQALADAKAAAARLKATADEAKTAVTSQTGQGSATPAANTTTGQPASSDQPDADASAATTAATDASTAASSIVLAAATNVPAISTGPKSRATAVLNSHNGGNAAGGAAAGDSPEQAETAGDADAALAAGNASPAADPIQPFGPSRSTPANSRAANQSDSSENPAAIVADAIAAETIGAAAGTALPSTDSGSSIDTDDSTAKPATAPVASTTTPPSAAGANPAVQNTNVAAGTPAFNVGAAGQASGAASNSGGGSTSGTNEVDRVRFVQRVARAFQAADEDGGQIRLRLSPPELGSMKLEITMQGGTMTAHVETETSAARNMLLDNLPALRQRLADQNIKIGQFDVDLKDQSGGGAASGSGFADPRNQMPQYAPRTSTATVTDPIAISSSQTTSLLGGSGQLNVVV
jgi:flagellar hook-length control protein FliK